MSFLQNLVAGLTPPPFENPVEYNGWEYKWKLFVFRPALLHREVFLLSALLLYVAFYFVGSSRNRTKATSWFEAHLPIFSAQFSAPTNGGLTYDGSSDAFNFSTGRKGVTSLHTIFTLCPRHDLLQTLYHFGRSLIEVQYRKVDSVELDIRLAPGTTVPDFVWAVVHKDELLTIKDSRWDLTFTRSSENSQIHTSLSVMSEFADVTENLVKAPIMKIISDPAILPYFRSLSVTDQPRERPTTGALTASEREKHVILSLTAPPAHLAGVTAPLVNALFPFIDSLPKINLRPETRTKLKKMREDIDKELTADANREKTEEAQQALEDKKAAKRKAEEERISRLSAAEQKKILEREKKRSMRKQQGKVVRK